MEMNTKKDKAKTEILAAAEKVFQKWGLNKTTMEDIAKAAGRCKGSLYYYYKDKEEILNTLTSGYIRDIIDIAESEISTVPFAIEKLKTYFISLHKEFRKYVNLFEIIQGEIKGYPSIIESTRMKFDTANKSIIRDIIIQGIDTGEFKRFNKSEIDMICYSIITCMAALGMDVLVENRKINVKRRIDDYFELFYSGLKN